MEFKGHIQRDVKAKGQGINRNIMEFKGTT